METQIWQAIELESVREDGRTKPLVLWCEPEAGNDGAAPQRFLVKSPGHPEILESSLFAELFGNLLAREFGIVTPRPALIVLSEPFVRSIQPALPASIQLRGGFGVGCEYLPALKLAPSDFSLTTVLRAQAALIYAFDLLTTNFDHRVGNPNCALLDGQLVAYDFENCFSFLHALFGPKPWMVSRLGIANIHIFQKQLKSGGADWTPFTNAFKLLNENRMSELIKDIPLSWQSNAPRVFDYILEAQGQSKPLLLELENSLHT